MPTYSCRIAALTIRKSNFIRLLSVLTIEVNSTTGRNKSKIRLLIETVKGFIVISKFDTEEYYEASDR